MSEMLSIQLTEAEATTAFEAIGHRKFVSRCDCDSDVGFRCKRCRRLESLGIDYWEYANAVAYRYACMMKFYRTQRPKPTYMEKAVWIDDGKPAGDVKYAMHPLCRSFEVRKKDVFEPQHILPQERFVEYEPKDLEWMVPLGMAPERPRLDVHKTFEAIQHELFNRGRSLSGSLLRGMFWLPGQD